MQGPLVLLQAATIKYSVEYKIYIVRSFGTNRHQTDANLKNISAIAQINTKDVKINQIKIRMVKIGKD